MNKKSIQKDGDTIKYLHVWCCLLTRDGVGRTWRIYHRQTTIPSIFFYWIFLNLFKNWGKIRCKWSKGFTSMGNGCTSERLLQWARRCGGCRGGLEEEGGGGRGLEIALWKDPVDAEWWICFSTAYAAVAEVLVGGSHRHLLVFQKKKLKSI